MLAKIVLAFIN